LTRLHDVGRYVFSASSLTSGLTLINSALTLARTPFPPALTPLSPLLTSAPPSRSLATMMGMTREMTRMVKWMNLMTSNFLPDFFLTSLEFPLPSPVAAPLIVLNVFHLLR
jgi:hypothetical protein